MARIVNQGGKKVFPLWIEGKRSCSFSRTASLAVPEWILNEAEREVAARRIGDWGFNALIVGALAKQEISDVPCVSLAPSFLEIQKKGIRIGIKPTFHIDQLIETLTISPFDKKFENYLKSEIEKIAEPSSPFDFFVYESLSLLYDEMGLNHDDDHLFKEIAQAEIALVEKMLPKGVSLIYLFPGDDPERKKREASVLQEIALKSSKTTILSISSRQGSPFLDHLQPHPFLRQKMAVKAEGFSYAALVNLGGIQQGGGLWPSVPLDIFQGIYPLLEEKGVMAIPIVHTIPEPDSFLGGALTLASHSREGPFYPEGELAKWLISVRCETEIDRALALLRDVREIIVDFSRMREALREAGRDHLSHDECKTMACSLYYKIRKVEREGNHWDGKSGGEPSLRDYMRFFCRDAYRTLLHFIQSFNVVIQESLDLAPGKKGFWTDFTPGSGSGLRGMGKVSLLKLPLIDQSIPEMAAIFKKAGY